MVLLVEDDSATIKVIDELLGNEHEMQLSLSSSVRELVTTVMDDKNYSPGTYDLVLLKVEESEENEVNMDEDKSLKEAGLLHGCLKILSRKTQTPPSIVISLANKKEDEKVEKVGEEDNCMVKEERTRHKVPVRYKTRLRHREPSHTQAFSKAYDELPKASSEYGSSYSSYTSSSSFSWSRWNLGYVGLVNQAMTCYLNSLLQALYMTPEFRNSLYKWEFIGCVEETPKSIPYQLQKLFLSLQTSTRTAVETSKLTKSFGWDASDSWQQHDIQELCRVMFDALEQKFKDTDQADFINNLYQGKLVDYVTCLECKTEKKRIDTFLDIPLPVRPFGSNVAYNSVAEAMHAFIQPETLDGNNQYFCETCNKKCDAHKGLKFSHFPYILTLHLKRFDFDYNAMTRIKLTDRVEFPQVLNINGFLCEEARSHLSNSTSTESPSPVNEEVKGDDTSITDSVSTGDDEGCQGAEALHGSTSGSNCSGSNVDMQDYDEGIDLSNGISNQEENEKNLKQNEGHGPPGPYIYELFSIMIHSGSASGGHYYVYIKDFDKGEWFCFDDQAVSRITNEDISMTYGGGSHRGYYSGAHSSSTNAYMLMYRQIDKKQNQAAMAVDEFPPHIKELVKRMQEEEEEERMIRERDKDRLKIKLYCHLPGEDSRSESKLVIDGDTTLADAANIAHKLFHLDDIVPLEQCRLVSYDSTNETMDLSFEDRESEPMSDIYGSIQNPLAQSLYLEIREQDAQFEPYRPGGVGIKVYRVNMKTREVDQPVEVRTQLTTSFGEMRPKIAKAVKLSPNIKIMMEEYGRSPIQLGDDKTLQSAGFYTINKIFVAEISETDSEVDFIDKMSAIIERFSNTITLYCSLPDTDHENLLKLGITPIASDGCKLTNGDCDATGDAGHAPFVMSKGISRGASPQLPPFEGEEECVGAAACSDQSTSEDSSLTDSDRTIVGDEADYCLAELSSASNSPPGSDQPSVSSPDEKEPPPFAQMEEDCTTDEELFNSGYLKIYPCKTHDLKNMVRIQVDKRMIMGSLKSALAHHMGILSDYVKLFRKCRSNEIPCSSMQDPLHHLRDEEHVIVRLERALRHGEYRGKVYQLFADDEPIKFLFDWILTKDMLVGEAKQQVLEELRRKDDIDIPFESRCRLRCKKWKNPGKILLDSQSFKDLRLAANWELFLQELDEPENVTSPSQVTLILKRFSSSNRASHEFHELTLQGSSFSELQETLSSISGIPLDDLQFSRPVGNFPYIFNKRDLQWDATCNCALEDGTVLYYRFVFNFP
ncbi:hypothetical protein ONE63_001586 [Megalurothrips usitatus]|uniref:Ubiquitin carboxyl-terminal hydrolase 47 n=1 Tax=Megalurothrips usitatus TaxID=439358 RepID=A0AAV7XH87_9NEOP|nr:hypothetical protein ONE63_001586 [Megalurothrips usitatus]